MCKDDCTRLGETNISQHIATTLGSWPLARSTQVYICIYTLPFPNGLSEIAQYTPNIHRYRQRGIIVPHGFVMLFAFIKAQTKFQQGLVIHAFEVNRSKAQKLGRKPTTICHIHHDSMIGHNVVVVDRPISVTHKQFHIRVVQV